MAEHIPAGRRFDYGLGTAGFACLAAFGLFGRYPERQILAAVERGADPR
jgi:hypothetical protein